MFLDGVLGFAKLNITSTFCFAKRWSHPHAFGSGGDHDPRHPPARAGPLHKLPSRTCPCLPAGRRADRGRLPHAVLATRTFVNGLCAAKYWRSGTHLGS